VIASFLHTWATIGHHAGPVALHVGPFVLLALALMWFRRCLRNLRRDNHPRGKR
jgi:hypothetical protein